MKNMNKDGKFNKSIQIFINLLSGATAGVISRTLTAPTDRIKTVLQTSRGVPLRPPGLTKNQFRKMYSSMHHGPDGIIQAAVLIYKEGGLKGFWRGNGINVLKVIPDEALKFTLNCHLKSKIAGDPKKATLVQNIAAGAISGVVAQVFVYPLEVVKTRMTVAGNGEWKSIIDCLKYTYRRGWKEFYKGFIPNILGIIPFQGTYFGLFFYLTGQYELNHPHHPPPAIQFYYSIISSSIAVFTSYPLNLVRTKLQTQGVNGRAVLYRGTSDCLMQSIRHEGVKGLYRGLMANYLKALPSLSISLVLVKEMSDTLQTILL